MVGFMFDAENAFSHAANNVSFYSIINACGPADGVGPGQSKGLNRRAVGI